jgi:hypothetical protein
MFGSGFNPHGGRSQEVEDLVADLFGNFSESEEMSADVACRVPPAAVIPKAMRPVQPGHVLSRQVRAA